MYDLLTDFLKFLSKVLTFITSKRKMIWKVYKLLRRLLFKRVKKLFKKLARSLHLYKVVKKLYLITNLCKFKF